MGIKPYVLSPFLKKLIWLGKKAYSHGYVVANGGNLSCRIDDFIVIKKSGCSLSSLTPRDFLITSLNKERVREASIDYKIHRAIYLNSTSLFVLHAHPENVIALSIQTGDSFSPLDFESKYYLGNKIPIVSGNHKNIHRKMGLLSSENKIIIERGHGVYIHGKSVIELFRNLERLEHAAKVVLKNRVLG
jgi:L-fuculose-phosphate aldolase